jgi:acetyl-CoA carboxylase carboxyltransferase component
VLGLMTAILAVMGPVGAFNAVSATKIAEITDAAEREAYVAARRAEYIEDVDLLRLASELVMDAVIEPEDLRRELIARFENARGRDRHFSDRHHGIPPV